MVTNAEKVRAVINTLETLNIPSTFDNVNKMTGIYSTLVEVLDSLNAKEGAEDAGKAEAE